jgi:hypothetical protein
MSNGSIIAWQVPRLREIEPGLRRGRLLAARAYKPGSIPRRAILGGFWDGGTVVRSRMWG